MIALLFLQNPIESSGASYLKEMAFLLEINEIILSFCSLFIFLFSEVFLSWPLLNINSNDALICMSSNFVHLLFVVSSWVHVVHRKSWNSMVHGAKQRQNYRTGLVSGVASSHYPAGNSSTFDSPQSLLRSPLIPLSLERKGKLECPLLNGNWWLDSPLS